MKREAGWTYVGTPLGECRISHQTLGWEAEAPELLELLQRIDQGRRADLRPAEALALEAADLLGGKVLESLPDPDALEGEREAELAGVAF